MSIIQNICYVCSLSLLLHFPVATGQQLKMRIEGFIPHLHESFSEYKFSSPEHDLEDEKLDNFEYDIAHKLLDIDFMEKVRSHLDSLFTVVSHNETIRQGMTSFPTDKPLLTAEEASSAKSAKEALIFKSFTIYNHSDSDKNCGPSMTGYVGPTSKSDNMTAARQRVLDVITKEGANIREIFGLLYCMSKDTHDDGDADSDYFENILKFAIDTPGISYGEFLNVAATKARFDEMKASTRDAFMNDIYIGRFDSWTRFLFGWPPSETGSLQKWDAARKYTECHTTNASASHVEPPLSERELIAQGCTSPTTCQLKWYPGKSCYRIVHTGNYTDEHGRMYPSYWQTANHFNYRIVAGPSGTTATYMQIFTYLNFDPSELADLRKALIAWMIPTDDHSIFEILLSAEPYMPPGESMLLKNSSVISLMLSERESSSDDGLKTWELVAIIAGSALFLIIMACLLYHCCCKNKGEIIRAGDKMTMN